MNEPVVRNIHLNQFWNNIYLKVIAGYLVGCWTFLEFFSFILKKFKISHHWEEVALYAIILFLPSVLGILFIPQQSNKAYLKLSRKFLPFVNIALIFIVIFFRFQDRDLGSVIKSVEYSNEEGELVTSQVLKANFVKRVAIFPFEQLDTANNESKWLALGIPKAVRLNLNQFQGIYPVFDNSIDFSFKQKMDLLGAEYDYVLDGKYKIKNDSFFVQHRLFNDKGKIVSSGDDVGADLFIIIDNIKSQMIEVIEPINMNNADLPFASFVTDDLRAFEFYVQKLYADAYKRDPDFFYAYLNYLALSYRAVSGMKNLTAYLMKEGLSAMSKVPERDQLIFKQLYFQVKSEKEKAKKAFELYLLLNPNDQLINYEFLVFLEKNGYHEEAINLASIQINERFEGNLWVLLFDLCAMYGKSNLLEEYNQKFKKTMPLEQWYFNLGMIKLIQQKYHEALVHFEHASIEKPQYENIDSMISVVKYYQSKQPERLMQNIEAISGNYLASYSGDEVRFGYQDNTITVKHKAQGTGIAFLLNDTTIFQCQAILHPPQHRKVKVFRTKANGNIISGQFKRKSKDTDWNHYEFKFFKETPLLKLANSNFISGNYLMADSLFSLAYKEDTSNYIALNNKRTCEYHLSDRNEGLLLEKEKWMFGDADYWIKVENAGDYSRMYTKNRDEYLFYPTPDGYLYSHDTKVEIIRNENEKKFYLQIYRYSNQSSSYKYLGQFSEFVE